MSNLNFKPTWTPSVPRPKKEEFTDEFLLYFIKKEYPDTGSDWDKVAGYESQDDYIRDLALYTDLEENNHLFDDPDELMTELIRWHGWNMADWEHIESIDYEFSKLYESKLADWTKSNNYTCPFKLGDKVITKTGKTGKVNDIDSFTERNHTRGVSCILFPDQEAKNQENEAKGDASRILGTYCNWEDLMLIEE